MISCRELGFRVSGLGLRVDRSSIGFGSRASKRFKRKSCFPLLTSHFGLAAGLGLGWAGRCKARLQAPVQG